MFYDYIRGPRLMKLLFKYPILISKDLIHNLKISKTSHEVLKLLQEISSKYKVI